MGFGRKYVNIKLPSLEISNNILIDYFVALLLLIAQKYLFAFVGIKCHFKVSYWFQNSFSVNFSISRLTGYNI